MSTIFTKDFFTHMYRRKNFVPRLILVLFAVILMGFCLSWLVLCDMGTDPCTMMNLAVSNKLGMAIGDWQALLNIILLVFVVIFGGRNLGFGTLANMFLVGYSLQFFSWLWGIVLPADIVTNGIFTSMAMRIGVLIPALIFFIFAAALYMDVDLGTAPYDAMPYIAWNALKKKFPSLQFRFVRIGYDILVVLIAMLFGGKLGIVTALMAFVLGPVIDFVGKQLQKVIEIDE